MSPLEVNVPNTILFELDHRAEASRPKWCFFHKAEILRQSQKPMCQKNHKAEKYFWNGIHAISLEWPYALFIYLFIYLARERQIDVQVFMKEQLLLYFYSFDVSMMLWNIHFLKKKTIEIPVSLLLSAVQMNPVFVFGSRTIDYPILSLILINSNY